MMCCDVAVISGGPAGLAAALAARKAGAERVRAGMGTASANLRTSSGGAGRVRAGMGRCQAGFCSPWVMEILARELGVPMEEIRKNEPGSKLLAGKLGEVRA